MELLYSMRRKPLKCEPPQYESVNDTEVIRPICTISSANIIAFSSPTELGDCEGDTWGGHVYVCDLDTPWDSHKVTSTAYPVSALEWDGEGKQLLVATIVGLVSVFTQKDHLLNEWTCQYTANFPGEKIVRGIFFHNGRRIVALDKKADVPITDKYQMLRSTPTLKGFGGVACEGACVVTGSGLLGALTPAGQAADCLRGARDHVRAAAMAHKGGNIVVAAAGAACVRCYVCGLRGSRGAPLLALQPLAALQPPRADLLPHVSLAWCLREEADYLLVAGSSLSLWKCSERAHPVHKLFSKGALQGSTTPGGGQKTTSDCFNTVVWQRAGAWSLEAAGASGAAGACAAGAVWAAGGRAPGAALAVVASARALHLVPRDTHFYLLSKAVPPPGPPGAAAEPPGGGSSPPKKPKYGPGAAPGAAGVALSSVELSQSGACVVAVDCRAQLHVFLLPAHQPWADIPAPISAQQASSMLELALLAGHDCLDVLLALKPAVVDALYDRMTESFQRQPAAFQQYYFHTWLKLRIALCRSSEGRQATAAALAAELMARAAWGACAAGLRPDGPEPALAALLDPAAPDHDKSLAALEAKPEQLAELVPGALRTCLQRALDTALAALQDVAAHGQAQAEVWAAPGALGALRRLLLLARAAGAGGGAGAAAGAGGRAEGLARLLARLAASPAPKHDLIEECASLCAQWGGRSACEALPRCSVSAPHGAAAPLHFEYGVEPEALRFTPELPTYAQCETTSPLAMDSIRYMYLGGGWRPARWRQCARCGARALPAAQPARHPLQKAYDGRFLAACRCGGKWTLFSNV